MAKIDARGWIFQVQTGPTAWAEIAGVNTFELDPDANAETTDDTDFKSGGAYEGHVAQRGATCKVEGTYEVSEADDTVRDPGQEAVDELADKVGRESLGGFRYRHESSPEWIKWTRAFVNPGAVGGGNNDNTSWSATFTRSGRATTEAVAP